MRLTHVCVILLGEQHGIYNMFASCPCGSESQVTKSKVLFFQLNPAVLSPETSLGPVFFVLLWHVRLCKDILSFICILLFVGLKATYVFFSWLNYFLLASELNTLAMCGLVFVIGFLMFMLPIVPGTAVYLFSGVVAWFDWFEGH